MGEQHVLLVGLVVLAALLLGNTAHLLARRLWWRWGNAHPLFACRLRYHLLGRHRPRWVCASCADWLSPYPTRLEVNGDLTGPRRTEPAAKPRRFKA